MIFFFFNLHYLFYMCILTVLSIMAAANWKLFAFYGKFVRNRPSKKRFCQPHRWIVSSEIVPFFLHSLAGCSYLHWCWRALGRAPDVVQFWSIRLFIALFSPLFHAIHWRLRFVLWISLLSMNSKNEVSLCKKIWKKLKLHAHHVVSKCQGG